MTIVMTGTQLAQQKKRSIIRTAKDLCYSSDVITRLKSATTETEISRIMRNARLGNIQTKQNYIFRIWHEEIRAFCYVYNYIKNSQGK